MGKFAFFNSASNKQELPYYNELGDFVLQNQQNVSVAKSNLLGSVWVANFIFTRCAGPCPKMTMQMKELHEDLKDEGIGFVSFSVDSNYDKPEILRRYIKKMQVDDTGWFFLTGDQKVIHDLSIAHFLLGVTEIPKEEREKLDQGFNHSTKFALVDAEGYVRGYYDSTSDKSMHQLKRDAKKLKKQS
jgi:cytochrome oxidase Cu insertion factor (SCO1/SenC/PrrC family)